MASPGRDAPELPAYLPGLGVRGAGGDDALATPESSLLLVHLDRAIKCERAQAMDRIQRSHMELQRIEALLHAEAERVASARASQRVHEEKAATAAARAAAAERRADDAERALKAERKAWARERQDLVAAANAPRDEPPAELLAKATAEAERARPPDDDLEDLARAARAYVQLLESMQRAAAPPAPSPRVPSPRLPSPRTARAEPAPVAAASPRPELPGDPPKDEMEKLLLKYEQAKEKLQALELMYPN